MPQQFGRFWLHEKIGQGVDTAVFRASVGPDPDTYAFDFALKCLRNAAATVGNRQTRFLKEAEVGRYLRHPNLVRVFESGRVDNEPYIAMDYVAGMDLARLMGLLRVRGWRFPADLTVFVAMQVLRGLDYLHRATSPDGMSMQLVHRDVTPSNILVHFNGEVKIGDLGSAYIAYRDDQPHPISLERVPYSPPELLAGDPPSQSDDVWALGVCMYEMMAGRDPYPELDAQGVLHGDPLPPLPPVHAVNPEVDRELSGVVARMLHPKPHKRLLEPVNVYRELKGYLRSTGIQVNHDGLARFVVAATGTHYQMPSRDESAMASFFEETSTYHAPIGISMTQRIIMIQKDRRRWLPVAIGGGVLALGGVLAWVLS